MSKLEDHNTLHKAEEHHNPVQHLPATHEVKKETVQTHPQPHVANQKTITHP